MKKTVGTQTFKLRSGMKGYLAYYLRSACNQLNFDLLDYYSLGARIDDFSGIPRPQKWFLKSKKITTVIKILSPVIYFFWVYLFYYVFVLFCFFADVFFSNKKYQASFGKPRGLALAVSPRAIDVIKQSGAPIEDVAWLFFSGVKSKHEFKEVLTSDSVLGLKDKIKVLVFSFKAHRLLKKNKNGLALQSYTSYKWYSLVLCLEKLSPEKIIAAQHLDRWALLADSYAQQSDLNVEYHLVQHGLELHSAYQAKDLIYNFNKLKHVTHLYVYGEDQYEVFKENIIDFDCLDKLSVKFFKTRISLYDLSFSGRLKVLFIGHTICEDLQVAIFSALEAKFDFDFYYKPHPATKMSGKLDGLGWRIIKKIDEFPRVDYLVSYESTLLVEYQREGVGAFIHKIDPPRESFDLIVEKACVFFRECQVH
ncbi:hypothetical protein [Idiomarina abyssalis]|uniref:hypothetical protein n=1 Tax=Idiomarina abyssalis TaxID=86102 RepID=UPI003A8EB1F8